MYMCNKNRNTKLNIRIKDIRISNKITQQQLADKINVNRTTLSSYESGRRIPSIDVLWKIADVFDISIDNLVGRK